MNNMLRALSVLFCFTELGFLIWECVDYRHFAHIINNALYFVVAALLAWVVFCATEEL